MTSACHPKMRRRRRNEVCSTQSLHSCTCAIELHYDVSRDEGRVSSAMVHNVVGTAMIFCSSTPLDLNLIHSIMPNSTFKKKKFAAVTIRLCDPNCTVLLFASGKMVLTGCRDFMTCILACHSVVDLLRHRLPGFFLEVVNIQMQNIVGHVDLHLNDKILDLDRFYRDNNIECTFQRTMFPGLVYRAADSSVVMLIFASGRVVVTGAKSTVSVELAWDALRTKLLSYTINKEPEACPLLRVYV